MHLKDILDRLVKWGSNIGLRFSFYLTLINVSQCSSIDAAPFVNIPTR